MSQGIKNNSTPLFEALETRTMMSAVHPAIKAPAVHANPSVTDPSIHYTSFAADPLFSANGPLPTDVNQGDIGDCFFLSTLAAIAKTKPSIIKNDITTNNDGTYNVKLIAGNTVDTVRVTSDLPTWSDGQLAYAQLGTDNCTWVAIMEKAYADIRTKTASYASINGGWMSDAFSALGVKNTSVFAEATTTALFKLVQNDEKSNDALTYATGNYIEDAAPLIAGHAYEIDSITFSSTGTPATMTLRNPWGNAGPAIDGSSNNGYVTLSATQALANFSGLVAGLV